MRELSSYIESCDVANKALDILLVSVFQRKFCNDKEVEERLRIMAGIL
ncbi:MAG: hypothetical protein ACTS85_02145 [Arsenophonus sp. NC-PG7-MAG3]